MGLLTWSWKFCIAPVEILEQIGFKNGKPLIRKRYVNFVTRRTYSGFNLPRAGDVVDIPDHGPCKVERVIYPGGRPSKTFIVDIVISPKSINDPNWWKINQDPLLLKNRSNWSLGGSIIREDFIDLELPEDEYP